MLQELLLAYPQLAVGASGKGLMGQCVWGCATESATGTVHPPPLMSSAPLGLLLDFAAGDATYPLLAMALCSNFLHKTVYTKSVLPMRFAQVKEEPQRGGGHEAKRIGGALQLGYSQNTT